MPKFSLYRIEPDAATTGQQIRAVDDAIQDGVLVPVERCEHGNVFPHIIHEWIAPSGTKLINGIWCPGAGIGGGV